MRADCGGFYNADSCKLILSKAMKERGRQAVDGLITGLKLDRIFGFRPDTRFESGCALDPVQNRQ